MSTTTTTIGTREAQRAQRIESAAKLALSVLASVDGALKGGQLFESWSNKRLAALHELKAALDSREATR